MKVVILMSERASYGVLAHFSGSIGKAFERAGLEVAYWQGNTSPQIYKDFDFSFSFFVPLTEHNSELAWDYDLLPHVYFTVDTLDYHFQNAKRQKFLLSVRDEGSYSMFRQMGHLNTLLLPHAADQDISPEYEDKTFEITFFSSSSYLETIIARMEKFPESIQATIKEAISIFLQDPDKTYHHAFITALKKLGLPSSLFTSFDMVDVLTTLEMMIRFEDRFNLLKTINTVPVHIYGDASTKGDAWKDLLVDKENLIFHPAVSFGESLEIMKKSKIVLNSSPTINLGGHERIFYATLCGALPLTNDNSFLRREYKDEESILFYHPYNMSEVEPKIAKFLKDDTLRINVTKKGRAITLLHHSWDNRVKTLLESKEFSDLLK